MVDLVQSMGRLTRRFARMRGGRVLLEPWLRAFARGDREVELAEFDGDLELQLRLNEHMESRIFWYGSYSRDVLCALDRLLRPGDVICDVGANIGEISLFAAKRVGPRGRVLAVEAFEPTAARLSGHVRRNGFEHVDVVQCAIGQGEGAVNLFGRASRFRDGLFNSGMSSTFRSDDRSLPLTSVAMTSLDRLVAERGIEHVDGIKIDIEGGELAALRGATAIITRDRPWIVLEVNGDACAAAGYSAEDLLGYLTRLDYVFERVGRMGTLTPLRADELSDFQNVLCKPSSPVDG